MYNTHRRKYELSRLGRALRSLQSRPFLFLGYSLRDWNFRVVLNRIQEVRTSSGYVSWAIQLNPSAIEKLFWDQRNVRVYGLALEKFVEALTSRVPPGDGL